LLLTARSWNFLLGGIGIFPKVVHAARQMERLGVRHVHCHFANHPALAGFLVHRLTGIPFSFTAHGSDLNVDRTMLPQKIAEAAFAVTISETNRRRGVQQAYNEEHGINPTTVRKAVTDILSLLRPDTTAPMPGKDQRKRRPQEDKVLKELAELPEAELARLIQTLEEEMHEAAAELKFEYAARLRDEVNELRRELRDAG